MSIDLFSGGKSTKGVVSLTEEMERHVSSEPSSRAIPSSDWKV